QIKNKKGYLISGDATVTQVLKKARVDQASHIYLVSGEDPVNIESCLEIYKICEKKKSSKKYLQCILHLQQPEFVNSMKDYPWVKDMNDAITLKIFNVFENCARHFLQQNPLDFKEGISFGSRARVQLFIFGFGKNGEALALETGMNGHYANGLKPRIIVVDRQNEHRKSEFLESYPDFEEYCDLHYIVSEGDSPQLINHLLPFLKEPETLNTFVICFGNKTQNLMLSQQIEKMIPSGNCQIFARTFLTDTELSKINETKVRSYGLPQYTSETEAIFGESLDELAKALHEEYLQDQMKKPNFGKKEAHKPWPELDEVYKDSNRRAADHIAVKLRAIGCEIVSSEDPRSSFKLSPEELEILAQLEHRRWLAERQLTGWTYADIPQSDPKKKESPYILPWSQITKDIRDYDRDAVRKIESVLARVGKNGVRRLQQ
ncbi:MAG: NAD-binding protein, partial [Saprospiraceae bacterium]|nr:NAD-binding protein [Saprospiraceae bacterium]